MKTVKKFVLNPDKYLTLIPSSTILSAASEGSDIVVYAPVSSEDMDERPYEFRIFGTGSEIDIDLAHYTFLATVKTGSNDTYHVFYKGLSSADM